MREELWLRCRNSPLLRRLAASSLFGKLLKAASYWFLPSPHAKEMNVRAGIGKGLILEINPRYETTLWDGTYEPETQRVFAQHVHAATVYYDVGGGIGYYSLAAARLGANVIVFEPSASNAASIAHHLKRNGLESRVRIIPSAVFSYTGEISMRSHHVETEHADSHLRDQSCWVVPADQQAAQLPRVPCTTLDDFLKENPKPDFLKMDIEGAESEALKGAEMLFRTVRPPLVCEVHDEANAAFVTRWLQDRNYQSRWLEDEVRYPRSLYASPNV